MTKPNIRQIADCILMVRPANFGYNPQTAANNAFQTQDNSLSDQEISRIAIQEFDNFVNLLRNTGIEVLVVDDTLEPLKPDAVFPNNWISTHADGTVITYPMFAAARRRERREDIVELLASKFMVKERIRLEEYEAKNKYLEGTGSLILDRVNKLAYACRSVRTHEKLMDRFCKLMDYEKVIFDAVDQDGQPIYHTNVMMALGNNLAVICTDALKNGAEKAFLLKKLKDSDKEIFDISFDQMNHFAGNMLAVANRNDTQVLIMSEQAFTSLSESQKHKLLALTDVLIAPVYTIEKYGGGSVRCMMAEVFLPR